MGLAATYTCFTGFLIVCISLHPALSAVVQDPYASKNPFGNVGVKNPIAGSTFFEVGGWPGGASTPNPTGLDPSPNGIPQPATGPPNPTGTPQVLTKSSNPYRPDWSIPGFPQPASKPSYPVRSSWPTYVPRVPLPVTKPKNMSLTGLPTSVSDIQQVAAKSSYPLRSSWPTPVPGRPQPVAKPKNTSFTGLYTPVSRTAQPTAVSSNLSPNGWPTSVPGSPQPAARWSPTGLAQGRPTPVSGTPQQAARPQNSSTNGLPAQVSGTQQVAAKLPNRFSTNWPTSGTPQGPSNPSLNGWPTSGQGQPQPATKPSNTPLTGLPTSASGTLQPTAVSSNLSPDWLTSVPRTQPPVSRWSPTGSVPETANPALKAPISLQPGWPGYISGTPQQAAQPSNPALTGWRSTSGTRQQVAQPSNPPPPGWPTSVPAQQQPASRSPTGLVRDTANPTLTAPISLQPGWPGYISGTPQQAAQPSNPALTGWRPTSGTPQQVAQPSNPPPPGWPTPVQGTQQPAARSPTGLVPETATQTQQRMVPKPITKTHWVPADPSKSFRNRWASRLASRNPQKTPAVSSPTSKDGPQKKKPLIFGTKIPLSGSPSATSAPQVQRESKPLSSGWDIKATLSQLAQRESKQVTEKNAEQQPLGPSNEISSSRMPTPSPTKQVTEPPQTTPQQVSTEPNPVSNNFIQSAIDMVQKVQGAAGAQSANAISTGQVQSSKATSVNTGTLKELSSVISDLTRYLESTLGILNNTSPETPANTPQTTPGSSLPNLITPPSIPSAPAGQPIITETLSQPIVTNVIPSNGMYGDIPAPVTEMPNMFNPLTETPGASNLQPVPSPAPAPIPMMDILRSRYANPNLGPPSPAGPVNNAPSIIPIERAPIEVINTNQIPSYPNMNLSPVATMTTNQNAQGNVLSVFSTSGNPPVTISESSYGTIPIATESPLTAVAQNNQAIPETLVTNAVPSIAANAGAALAETPINQAVAEATGPTGLLVEQAGTQTGNTGSLMDEFAPAGTSTNQATVNPVTPVDPTTFVETPLNPATEMPIEQVGVQAEANPTTSVNQATVAETSLNLAPTSPTPTETPMEPAGIDTAVGQTAIAETPLYPAETSQTPTEMLVGTQAGPSAQHVAVDPTQPGQVMNTDQSLISRPESVGNPSWQTNNAVNTNEMYPDPNTNSGPLQNEQIVVGNNPFDTSNKIVLSPAAATIPGSPIAQTVNTGFAGPAAPETPISETANPGQQGTMPNFSLSQWNALRNFMAAFPQLSQSGLLQGIGAMPQTSITQPQSAVVAPPPPTMPLKSTSYVEPQPAAPQSQTVYQPQRTVQAPIEGQPQQVAALQVA